jgi:Lon-like ATP-dependent protease
MDDVLLEKRYEEQIEVIPVETLGDVIKYALLGKGKTGFVEKMQKISEIVPKTILKNPTTH